MTDTSARKRLLQRALKRIEELETQLSALKKHHAPIAIIGMGCRFPGNANNPRIAPAAAIHPLDRGYFRSRECR